MAEGETRGRRTKYAMMRLRKLQEEKVDEAERSFAILAELAQMEKLPKDWDARKVLCESVMNRVWGLPKARNENEQSGTQKIVVEYVKRTNGAADGNAPSPTADS